MAASSVIQLQVRQLRLLETPQTLENFPEQDVEYLGVKELKKGRVVMLRDRSKPCKLVEIQKSKTGKHGTSKYHLRGVHVLSGKTYDDIFYTGDTILFAPEKKEGYRVLNCGEYGNLVLESIDRSGHTRDDIAVNLEGDDDLAKAIFDHYWSDQQVTVTVYTVLGYSAIIGAKIEPAED